ncbi:TauD/TfdA family dioxygenase [Streptomyces collinus]|uniref:Oxygenase (Secreted protein) n=1 Tax=Streptomyces collinus (strain DSM 40733 / Tue 365) TaxID=1214242 RepID=S5VUT4_STRC3|nr:oxygenase (secreted protein) [Streptomyces collinus Tu 365]UJA10231.1 clavaminate synthase [Streptomyces collinus]UJA14905.1 clavaminate synthase [Streptomyces collinus]
MTQIEILAPAAESTVTAHELTAAEQTGLIALAGRLTGPRHPLIDSPDWLAAAREATSLLPRRLLGTLRAFRHDPGPDGVLLLRGVPVTAGEPLRPTPGVPNSVEHVPTAAAAAIVSVMLQLGEVVAFRNEKSGALVQNVVPVPGKEDSQSNAGSVLLELHVENAFHDNRPDYVGLLCMREDPTGDAKLCTSSIRRALPLLTGPTRRVLGEPRFLTEPPPSFGALGGVRSAHPVLLGDLDDPNVLVDFAATHPLDEQAEEAMAELREAFVATMAAHRLRVGDLAVVDNRVAVHGRTSFTPRYDGEDRWLERVYAHLDNRRSRVDRLHGGAVLN